MAAWSIPRWKSELDELEQSLDRAGRALGCAFSSAEEYESAVLRRTLDARHVGQMRTVLGATAGLCVVALVLFLI